MSSIATTFMLADDRANEELIASYMGADERRLHLQAYRYWESHHSGPSLPRLSNCADIYELHFSPRLAIVGLASNGSAGSLLSVGEGLDAELSPDHGATRDLFADLLEQVTIVGQQGLPLLFSSELPALASANCDFAFRGILLPLHDDDDHVAFVMAVIGWRNAAMAA